MWANGKSSELKQFDFIFHIALKDAKQTQRLEDMIVDQHAALKRQKASPDHIRQILEGQTNKKMLLLLDGYDEYKKGTNSNIDNILIRKSLPHSCVLLTSRDIKELIELRPHMDVEAEITGFDPERVEEYMASYLGSQRCQKLIELTKQNQLRKDHGGNVDYGIMQIPIFLHMICVLYQRKVSLPRTRTGIISAIVGRCPDWEEIRKSGMKTRKEWKAAFETALNVLGKVAWQRLREGNKDLVFQKVTYSQVQSFFKRSLYMFHSVVNYCHVL